MPPLLLSWHGLLCVALAGFLAVTPIGAIDFTDCGQHEEKAKVASIKVSSNEVRCDLRCERRKRDA